MKKKQSTKDGVLYQAILQAIWPLKESIAASFDELYHIPPEDRVINPDTPLHEVLEWAEAVVYDYEVNTKINEVVEGMDL